MINQKNIKLPPVPPLLPLVALFVPILLGIVPPKACIHNLIHGGVTGGNFILLHKNLASDCSSRIC